MAYTFKTGFCKKSELYDLLLQEMTTAGWRNITSNYATDGDVMYSTGKNGDKKIVVRMFPYYSTYNPTGISASSDKTYSTRSTGAYSMGIQLQKSYVPGESGAAGIFSDPKRYVMCLLPTPMNGYSAILSDLLIEYYLHVDKSKVILFSKYPDLDWTMTYFGLPDTLYAKCNEGRGTLFISTNFVPYGQTSVAGQIAMSEYPDEGGGIALNQTLHYPAQCTYINPILSPNRNNQYFLSELYVQSAQYGTIAKLDGIWGTGAENLNSGDIITVDGKKYRVFRTVSSSTVYPILGDYSTHSVSVNNIGLTGIAIEVV